MNIPSMRELKSDWQRFVEKEELEFRTLLQPKKMYGILLRAGYIQFFLVGGGGVVVNLFVTWALTTFVFGLPNYFTAYIFGLIANLIWSFTLFSFAIFKTKSDHARRLIIFAVYFVAMTYVNTLIVRAVVALVGVEYYLIVIAGTILLLSTINFLVFKLSIFKERL